MDSYLSPYKRHLLNKIFDELDWHATFSDVSTVDYYLSFIRKILRTGTFDSLERNILNYLRDFYVTQLAEDGEVYIGATTIYPNPITYKPYNYIGNPCGEIDINGNVTFTGNITVGGIVHCDTTLQ